MNIAELFVNLGIKGTDKTVGALTSVKSGLGEVKSMSLEAKAGLLALMYGLEKMMSISGKAGTELTNFTAFTGLSKQKLQEWQYAARQAGESSEEFTSSLKGVQSSMGNMLLGKGAPEGFAMVKSVTNLDTTRLKDTFYVMQQLQKAAQRLPVELGNVALKSFGLSEATIAAMRRNAFNPTAFAKAPKYSDNEINALNKSNIAWDNLGQHIQMAIGHLNAKHGLSLVKDITVIADKVLILMEQFTKLAEKIKLFEIIGKIFEGWAMVFNGISAGVDKLTGFATGMGSKFGLTDKSGNLKQNPVSMVSDWIGEKIKTAPMQFLDKAYAFTHDNKGRGTTIINQTFTGPVVADKKSVANTHKNAANAAYRQRPNYVGN